MYLIRPLLAAGAILALASAPAFGQQVYRIVGPDGRVTFSDTRPLDPAAKATTTSGLPVTDGTGIAALPFELRQVVTRYPVTLYTAPNCVPCSGGRSLLAGRGIPFTERTVSTNDDIEALQRISGAASLPFMTIGGQQIKGFSEIEWAQFLDAAGYPRTSQLPAGYRYAPATPLVVAQDPTRATPEGAGAAATAAAPAQRAPTQAPPAAGENPAGIRF